MARYGIAISQEGTPVDRAADYQKVLDDRWPYLDIADERYYNVDVDVSNFTKPTYVDLQPIFAHNLGYIPAFSAKQVEYSGPQSYAAAADVTIVADDKYIYAWVNVNNNSGGFFTNSSLHWRFLIRTFACDITRDFIQPVDQPSPGPGTNRSKYGLKILKDGKTSMRSQDISDYSINTNGKAFSVQRTGTATVQDYDVGDPNLQGKFQIEHRLGYPPIFFIAQLANDATYTGGVSDPLNGKLRLTQLGYALRCHADATYITFMGGQSGLPAGSQWAYLILKDPLEGAS